jgi:SAM-dependent methyltransferase
LTKKKSYTGALLTRQTFFERQSAIAAIENNEALYLERNFEERVEAIDLLEFEVIYHNEDLLLKTTQPVQLNLLILYAEKIKSDLEAIDANLYQKLRAAIIIGTCRGEAFKNLVSEYIHLHSDDPNHLARPGYDSLDLLINGLFPFEAMPEQTVNLEPEMVYFQKTPARIIFELVENGHLGKDDIFYDLGSGLGQVVMLVNLLAGIIAKGVEFEPAFCDHARNCASELNLSGVQFINADARQADYSDGTVFFMFTPFTGAIMQDVLERLKQESLDRKIKIITYGPCSNSVALQTWLNRAEPWEDNIYKPAVFSSSVIV